MPVLLAHPPPATGTDQEMTAWLRQYISLLGTNGDNDEITAVSVRCLGGWYKLWAQTSLDDVKGLLGSLFSSALG
jgi:hypothetical protein